MTSQTIVVYENSVTPAPPAVGYRSMFPVADGWKEIDSAGVSRYFARLNADNASLTVAGVLAAGASAGVARSIDFYGGAAATRFQPSFTSAYTISGMTELGNIILRETSGISVATIDWYADGNGAGRDSQMWLTVRDNGTQRYLIINGATNTLDWAGGLNIGTATSAAAGAWRAKVATGEQIWMRPPGDFGAGYGPIIQAVDSAGTGSIQLVLAGSSVRILNELRLDISTAASASAGGGATLPATVAGYLVVSVAGTNRKIPFYAT